MTISVLTPSAANLANAVKKLKAYVNISDYGDVTTSVSTANTAFTATLTAINNVGCVVNPKNSLVDFSTITIPNTVQVIDMANQRLIMSLVGIGKSVQGGGGHLLLRDIRTNHATRVHIEPNGFPIGVAGKFDVMFSGYEDDGVTYRLANLYTTTYDVNDASTTVGNNGVAVLGVKGTGKNYGIWPALHIGFNDDLYGSAVPLKLYYFDTSDTVWRTPMIGPWRTGLEVNSGEYALCSNKLYQSSTTGPCGNVAPSHSSGLVNDGNLNWTFIRDFQAANQQIKGCVVIGDRDDLPKFGLPNLRAQIAKDIGFWNGTKLQFLDNAGNPICNVQSPANTGEFTISTIDGTSYLRFNPAGKFVQFVGLAVCRTAKVIQTTNTGNPTADALTDAYPDCSGASKIIFAHTVPRTINGFKNLPSHGSLLVASGNGNTTLVHSATEGTAGSPSIATATNLNRVLNTGTCLQYEVNSAATQAIEVGRN